jgi:hypothetical protein
VNSVSAGDKKEPFSLVSAGASTKANSAISCIPPLGKLEYHLAASVPAFAQFVSFPSFGQRPDSFDFRLELPRVNEFRNFGQN